MQITLSKTLVPDPDRFIRRSGYGQHLDRRSAQKSYVRRLHGDLYPRFHIYVQNRDTDWLFNLHLDQRAPVYPGVTAHGGEYDGAVVEQEADYLRRSAAIR